MKKSHKIQKISFSEDKMVIKVDGKKYIFKIADISQKLEAASQAEREKYEISPSGYGIHWPALDEDLSIDGLLGIKHKPSINQESVSA
jgi:hypothetical protein